MLIPANYAQTNLHFVGAALPRNMQVALGWDITDAGTPFDVASDVGENWGETVMTLMPATVTLEKVVCKFGPNDTGPEATASIGVPGDLDEDEPFPPNAAILFTKVNAMGGRKNKGKLFLGGIPEANSDGGGLLTPGALAAWTSVMSNFLDACTTDNLTPVILHTDVTAPTIYSDLVPQQRMATQKRRLRRAGGRRTPAP